MNINEIDGGEMECTVCMGKDDLNGIKWTCSYCFCEMHFMCGNAWLVKNKRCPGCGRDENFLVYHIPQNSKHKDLLKAAIEICSLSIVGNFKKTGEIAGDPYYKINLENKYATKYGFDSLIINIYDDSALVTLYLNTHEVISFRYKPFKRNEKMEKQFYYENQNSYYIDLIENILDNILI